MNMSRTAYHICLQDQSSQLHQGPCWLTKWDYLKLNWHQFSDMLDPSRFPATSTNLLRVKRLETWCLRRTCQASALHGVDSCDAWMALIISSGVFVGEGGRVTLQLNGCELGAVEGAHVSEATFLKESNFVWRWAELKLEEHEYEAKIFRSVYIPSRECDTCAAFNPGFTCCNLSRISWSCGMLEHDNQIGTYLHAWAFRKEVFQIAEKQLSCWAQESKGTPDSQPRGKADAPFARQSSLCGLASILSWITWSRTHRKNLAGVSILLSFLVNFISQWTTSQTSLLSVAYRNFSVQPPCNNWSRQCASPCARVAGEAGKLLQTTSLCRGPLQAHGRCFVILKFKFFDLRLHILEFRSTIWWNASNAISKMIWWGLWDCSKPRLSRCCYLTWSFCVQEFEYRRLSFYVCTAALIYLKG